MPCTARLFSACLMLAASLALGQKWTPPESPDPSTILNEAQNDARAGRYEQALAKHVWYHENALRIEPAQYGVRLSFALSSWVALASKYPPALVKLQATRDAAMDQVIEGKSAHQAFHEFKSINEYLETEDLTVELFVVLHEEHPKVAKEVYDIAKDALLPAKKYALCGRYSKPKEEMDRMLQLYQWGVEFAEERVAGQPEREPDLEFAQGQLTHEAANLVALMAVTKQPEIAKKLAAQAKEVWDDEAYHKTLDQAVEGKFPKPWP